MVPRRILLGLAIAVAAGAAACGGDGAAGDAGADGGADTDTDTDADTDADGGGDGGADTDTAPLTDNTMLISTGIYNDDGVTNIVVENAVAAEGGRCRFEAIEGCYVIDCTPAAAGDPLPAAVDLGAVALRRGDETLLTAEPDADGVYPITYVASALWNAGDELAIELCGGDVVDLAVPFTAPAMVTLIDPTGPLTISAADPLPVAWEPIEGGVTITMSQVPADAANLLTSRRFLCEVDGSAGAFEVPPSVLAVLDPGSANFNVGGNAVGDFEVSGYTLHIHAAHATTITMTVE